MRLIEPWNRTHLYTCGTGAYKPICTFINRGWRAEVRTHTCAQTHTQTFLPPYIALSVQEYLFRLVPGYGDSGKGKCSYDPRQENAAALISETSSYLFIITVPTTVLPYGTYSHYHNPLCCFLPCIQMGICMQGSTLTSWARIRPSLEPWGTDLLSGRSNMTPAG